MMNYPDTEYLKGTIKSPLEKGDTYVDFEAYNQDRELVRFSQILAKAPVMLFTTWSNATRMRETYLKKLAELQQEAVMAGYQMVSLNREVYQQLAKEKQDLGLSYLIAIDDDHITDYRISMTYTGANPFEGRSQCFFIDPSGTIIEKIVIRDANDMDLFFDRVRQILKGGV